MELWKSISGYEGLYEVSNLGRVKSLEKKVKNGKTTGRIVCERILREGYSHGYAHVVLYREPNRGNSKKVHLLVWDHFGDKPRDSHRLQIDHIDNNKSNNHINNLRLTTNRDNNNKRFLLSNKASKFAGVSWSSQNKKWKVSFRLNNKRLHLGYFDSENDAAQTYQKALAIFT